MSGFELASIPFNEEPSIPAAFAHFFNLQILTRLTFNGYKINEKQRVALHCAHNVSVAALRNKVVSDSRSSSSNGLRTAVWDTLIEAGLCRIWKKGIQGIPGSVDARLTQYRATKKLLGLLRRYEQRKYIDPRLRFNTERKRPTHAAHFVFHTGRTDPYTGKRLPKKEQKRLIPLRTLDPEIREFLAGFERRNAIYNEVMGEHDWVVERPDGISYVPNNQPRP